MNETIDKFLAETKVCQRCKTEKPIGEFNKNKLSADGHVHTCKKCNQTGKVKKSKQADMVKYESKNVILERVNQIRKQIENDFVKAIVPEGIEVLQRILNRYFEKYNKENISS